MAGRGLPVMVSREAIISVLNRKGGETRPRPSHARPLAHASRPRMTRPKTSDTRDSPVPTRAPCMGPPTSRNPVSVRGAGDLDCLSACVIRPSLKPSTVASTGGLWFGGPGDPQRCHVWQRASTSDLRRHTSPCPLCPAAPPLASSKVPVLSPRLRPPIRSLWLRSALQLTLRRSLGSANTDPHARVRAHPSHVHRDAVACAA